MKKYKLLKDWKSKRHNKILKAGAFVVVTIEKELKELIEGDYIIAPKIKKAKKKKEEKGSIEETN
tara:strand:- start:4855 stop:5049 length:195 start_codon:yes stop_codon:yes gene_type:complete